MEDAGHELLLDAVDRFPLRKSQEDPDSVPLAVLQTGEANPAVPAESNTGSVRVAGPERRRHEPSLTRSAQSTDRVNPEAPGWTKSCLDMAEAEPEWTKCFEPGVYLKLKQLSDGTQDLKKVRFSSKCFTDSQAQDWWKENRDKVYERYNVRTSLSATSSDACTCGVCLSLSALVA